VTLFLFVERVIFKVPSFIFCGVF